MPDIRDVFTNHRVHQRLAIDNRVVGNFQNGKTIPTRSDRNARGGGRVSCYDIMRFIARKGVNQMITADHFLR